MFGLAVESSSQIESEHLGQNIQLIFIKSKKVNVLL